MQIHANKIQIIGKKASSTASAGTITGLQLRDNRPKSVMQKKQVEAMAEGSPVQKKRNNTGLPEQLKSGIENLSGHSMDDVKVHYNSNQPAQLNAHAYAQGADIHITPGQEKHLPHEAWHVVQQKQGRVKPTMQMKGRMNINDDNGLEKEADMMGEKALQMKFNGITKYELKTKQSNQDNFPVQRAEIERNGAFPAVNEEIVTGNNVFANAVATSIKVNILDESTDLFVGQDYLNTELSAKYKADAGAIPTANAKVRLFDEVQPAAAVVDGHHRVIWGLYHNTNPKFQEVTIGEKGNIGAMKYADTPKAAPIEQEKKGGDK